MCRDELTKLTEKNGKLETDETNAKNIQSDVIMIDRYYTDVKQYNEKEQVLATKISKSGSTRNLQEAINELKILRSTLNNINNVLDKNQHELDEFKETLFKLQGQQNELTNEELNIKRKMQDEKGIIDKLKDLQNLEATLSLELDNAREAIEPIQENLEKCIKNLEHTKKQHNKNIENNRKEVRMPLYKLYN